MRSSGAAAARRPDDGGPALPAVFRVSREVPVCNYPFGRVRRDFLSLTAVLLPDPDAGPAAVLEDAAFESLVTAAALAISVTPDSATGEIVRRLAAPLWGEPLTVGGACDLAWRLAAGRKRLSSGSPLYMSWERESPRLRPCLLEDVKPLSPERATAVFRVLDGPHAGLAAEVEKTAEWLLDVFAGAVGLPEDFGRGSRDLCGLRCWMLVGVERAGQPRLSCPCADRKMRTFNRGLLRERETPCPRGMERACRDCPVGSAGRNPCHRSCRPWDYRKRRCPACGRERWVRPDVPDVCAGCRADGNPNESRGR